MEVCYCVVKELELSSEYFGRYCKTVVESNFVFISSKLFICKL